MKDILSLYKFLEKLPSLTLSEKALNFLLDMIQKKSPALQILLLGEEAPQYRILNWKNCQLLYVSCPIDNIKLSGNSGRLKKCLDHYKISYDREKEILFNGLDGYQIYLSKIEYNKILKIIQCGRDRIEESNSIAEIVATELHTAMLSANSSDQHTKRNKIISTLFRILYEKNHSENNDKYYYTGQIMKAISSLQAEFESQPSKDKLDDFLLHLKDRISTKADLLDSGPLKMML